jgi:uncharacterized protein involved in exopolysaccharide biosynthesis
MSAPPKTSRDQLSLVIDLLKRTLRHVWLVAIIMIVGAGLSVTLALLQKPQYDSETVLLYQEKISQSVLQGRDVAKGNRTTSARFKEMLLSRTTLSAVVEEFELYPDVVELEGTIAAAEKLRLLVDFSDRGAGTYRISYRGSSPEEAQAITSRLAALLQDKDETIRREQAEQTKKFLEGEKAAAENYLFETEAEFAAFVAKHPEFVAEVTAGGGTAGVGASIRAANVKTAKRPTGSSKLGALQRAAKRLKDRIANPDAPVVAPISRKVRRVESPALQQAREDLADAKRNFEDKSNRFTPKHPDVIAAKNNVAENTRRLRRLEAAERANAPKPVVSSKITPTASVSDLKRELKRIENEISRLKASSSTSATKEPTNNIADELVSLETEHARLQRRVSVAAQRLSSLEGRVFTAEITASSEFAEAAKLIIIDEAFLPTRPAGKGRKIIALAGTLVFAFLGCSLALGLALIDDRVYRRADIDDLGIAPVLIVIPKAGKKKKKKRFKRG